MSNLSGRWSLTSARHRPPPPCPDADATVESAIERLAQDYPTVACLVGAAAFIDAAATFLASALPRETGFGDWAAMWKWPRKAPEIGAVASIDRMRREAEAAACDVAVAPACIAALSAEEWTRSRARLHTATRFGWFAVPAPSLWLAHFEPGAHGDSGARSEGILVTRPGASVRARRIGPAEHRILAGLRIGESVGTATSAAHALYPDADITRAAHAILDSGAVATLGARG